MLGRQDEPFLIRFAASLTLICTKGKVCKFGYRRYSETKQPISKIISLDSQFLCSKLQFTILPQGISDGAGAILLASEEAAKNLKPLARLVGWSYVGVDPSIMGIGPVPAIENLLKVTGMSLKDVDLIEVSW